MNRKGMIFHVGIVLVAVIVLTQIYSVLDDKSDKITYELGHQQFALYEQYQELADMTVTLEIHARSFLLEAISETAKNGWFYSMDNTQGKHVSDCGQYYGYQVWQSRDMDFEECAPESSLPAIESYFNQYFAPIMEEMGIPSLKILEVTTGAESVFRFVGPSLSYRRGITSESVRSDIGELVTPPLVDYEQATALQGPGCEDKDKCLTLPEEDFYNLYSIEDPLSHHLYIEPDVRGGNAITKELAQALIDIGHAWHEQECAGESDCKASIRISSLSTGKHSDYSPHNIGNAADIWACTDSDGTRVSSRDFHYNRDGKEVFDRCYDLITAYYQKNLPDGDLYGPAKDRCFYGTTPCTQAQYDKLIENHFHHIHLNP
ncbi:MAG: hypothetical protein ACQESG_02860 [Nanobdellota archaeon]